MYKMKKTFFILIGISVLTSLTTQGNELAELKERVNELEQQVRTHKKQINSLQERLDNIKEDDKTTQKTEKIKPEEVIITRNLEVQTVHK